MPTPESGKIGAEFFFSGRDAARPYEIEIGSGKGTFLVQEATRCPERDFLGVENAGEFFRHATDRVSRHALKNVRMLYANAVEFITYWVADHSVAIIHLYFSDPWPKARHHKRRVLQRASLEQFHRVLQANGEVRLVSDHDDLWRWYEELIAASMIYSCARNLRRQPARAKAKWWELILSANIAAKAGHFIRPH